MMASFLVINVASKNNQIGIYNLTPWCENSRAFGGKKKRKSWVFRTSARAAALVSVGLGFTPERGAMHPTHAPIKER